MRLWSAFGVIVLAFSLYPARADFSDIAEYDPFIWLEQVEGARARAWVREQNDYTLKTLKADPFYEDAFAAAHEILTAKDRIPFGTLSGGQVYNFWQDDTHQRGIWRRSPLASYREGEPVWQTLLDLDALSLRQNEKWVWKGAQCLPPANLRCLVKLSRGGRDAVVVREFDLATRSFVKDGFEIAEGKTEIAWVDMDTIMVATNWGRGTLTASGYPRTVKTLSRGQFVSEASTVYEGTASDVSTKPIVEFDAAGKPERFIVRGISSFSAELFYTDANARVLRVPVPAFAEFKGLHKRQLLFALAQNWRTGGRQFLQGSLVAFSLDRLLETGGALPEVKSLFTPDAKSALDSVMIGRDAVYLSVLENVRSRVHEVIFDGTKWSPRRLGLPDDGTIELVTASPFDRDVMFKYASFLIPDRLYIMSEGGEPQLIAQLPPRFDAYDLEVSQFEAVSADGARIPYFFVRKQDLLSNGTTPTLLYAYGGFQIPTTPWYWSTAGKLWLEQGGAYAIANVRGGGEFGPRWHDAAKGALRQRNFDDLAAVARNMIARGFTSSRRLGVMGGSQGGLLAAGAFVQNPDLFNAVSAQVPLTDMLRYTHMSAGASWVSEYGDPADPRMRAIIARWSPYQNLKQGVKYPRVFFMTSTKDDRVHPGHARKMAAKMQANGQPYYYYEQADGGHDAATTLRLRSEQMALVYTYFRRQLMD
ncbi:MAG: prolyl oligopeptidase family serine peptidase [Alphaproteobacteria bacterium]|nr:prolyl oligopeptidase family serine peptidase [Alphaproteobacteria bacterium]